MKKKLLIILLPLLLVIITATAVHKFHMAIHQIEFNTDKKMLQITSRIDIEDLNKAIEKKYKIKNIADNEKETPENLALLKEYLATNFTVKVNGQLKPLHFLSKEVVGDVLVSYHSIRNLSKINSLEISNTILLEYFSDQQNMINLNVSGSKQSFVLTNATKNKIIKF